MMSGATWLDWRRDGLDWPHRAASRFIDAGSFNWHVQIRGPETGSTLLLLHGTGASSHSWRHMLPLLSQRRRCIAIDLPCHGFTRPRAATDLSLPGMTRAITALLRRLGVTPDVIIGHSAGAAIAIALAAEEERGRQPQVVGINGAFRPIRGERLFSPMAKLLFANPFSASVFSLLAGSTPLGGNLLQATGSPIDAEGAALYRRLLTSSGHVRGALGMMAAWDLTGFDRCVAALARPPILIAASDDPMVPAENSRQLARQCPGAKLALSERGGHLLHECNPGFVCRAIGDAIDRSSSEGVDAA
ncbi:alpha/beta fold hydrolase BchO [Rhizobium sp. TRM95796]|uniref:alpha/beta fold hydrolase BchO n=1 Tax=Rhizobium sp. TRM95796 TaxID=2979862 RepID=UPI0021E8D569|nr:alpha/beta fold hydrolase BchO [Rhizobium sp. TRM95796]